MQTTFLKEFFMKRIRNIFKKTAIGILSAAIAVNALPGQMIKTAKADPVEEYGTASTIYGGAAADVVDDYTFTPTGSSTPITTKVPSAQDRCRIGVYGVEPGATIYAYHIIEANYNRQGFIGWTQTVASTLNGTNKFESFHNTSENVGQVVAVDNFKYIEQDGSKTNTASATTVSNPDYNKGMVLTEENIANIAKSSKLNGVAGTSSTAVRNSTYFEYIQLSYDSTNKEYYTTNAEAGTYLIIVRSQATTDEYIYNPMIVSNDYSCASNALSLSNVTKIKAATGTTGQSVSTSYHDDPQYNYGTAASGVDTDANNSFKDYSFIISGDASTAANKKQGTYDTNDSVEGNRAGTGNNVSTYPGREGVVYHRDVESNGKVYAIMDGTAGTSPMTDVKTMALKGYAYAKKTSIGFEKNIVNASTSNFPDKPVKVDTNTAANDRVTTALAATDTFYYSKYDDVSEGETVTFDILTNIPDYFDTNTIRIVDVQSDGFDTVTASNVAVYAGFSNKLEAEDIALDIVKEENKLASGTDYNFTTPASSAVSTNSFAIQLGSNFVKSEANKNKSVIIRYSTKVNDNAVIGLNGNRNSAEVMYGYRYKYDYTMHYTFKPTIAKVGTEGSIEWSKDVTVSEYQTEAQAVEGTTVVTNPLAGAKFKLVRIGSRDGMNDGAYTANLQTNDNIHNETNCDSWNLMSDANGYLQFDSTYDGVDEGLYAIYETEAPAGYTINDRVYYIEITPDYEESLKHYIGVKNLNTTTIANEEKTQVTRGWSNPFINVSSGSLVYGGMMVVPNGYISPAKYAQWELINHTRNEKIQSNGRYLFNRTNNITGNATGENLQSLALYTSSGDPNAFTPLVVGTAYTVRQIVFQAYYNSTAPYAQWSNSDDVELAIHIYDTASSTEEIDTLSSKDETETQEPMALLPLINSYSIKEYNSGTRGITDASVNPQDATGYFAEVLYTWNADKTGKEVKETSNDGVLAIPNTKLTKLPTTGGVGTLVFTSIGLLLMGFAVQAFKKKETEE